MKPFADNRKRTGALGESHAASYLERSGYTILERNWRCRTGELDIVAACDQLLVFIEVRTRKSTSRYGTPAESVDARKQQQVRQTAQYYMLSKRITERQTIRFDVIAVILGENAAVHNLEHYINAF